MIALKLYQLLEAYSFSAYYYKTTLKNIKAAFIEI